MSHVLEILFLGAMLCRSCGQSRAKGVEPSCSPSLYTVLCFCGKAILHLLLMLQLLLAMRSGRFESGMT